MYMYLKEIQIFWQLGMLVYPLHYKSYFVI